MTSLTNPFNQKVLSTNSSLFFLSYLFFFLFGWQSVFDARGSGLTLRVERVIKSFFFPRSFYHFSLHFFISFFGLKLKGEEKKKTMRLPGKMWLKLF